MLLHLELYVLQHLPGERDARRSAKWEKALRTLLSAPAPVFTVTVVPR